MASDGAVAERAALPDADADAAARTLAEARRVAGASFDHDETLARIVGLLVPAWGDWAFVDLLAGDQHFERVAVGHHRPGGAEVAAALERTYPLHAPSARGVEAALLEGRTQLLTGASDELLRSIARDEEHLAALRALEARSAAIVPLAARGRTIGALTLVACARELGDGDLRLLEQFAAAVAGPVESARLFRAEARARDRLERMQTVVAALSSAQTAAEAASAACRIGAEAMAAHSGAMWLLQPDGSLELAGTWGTPKEFIERFQTIAPDADAPAQWAIREGAPVWVETERDYQRAAPTIYAAAKAAGRLAAFGALPMIVLGRTLGVLSFAHRTPHRYDEHERAFYVALAQHCAQALARALLFDERNAQHRFAELVQTVTEALSKAASAREVLEAVLDGGTRCLGAPQGAIWLPSDDESALELAYSRGFPATASEAYARIPLDVDAPVVRCLRDGTSRFVESRDAFARDFPAFEAHNRRISTDDTAFFCVPLPYDGRARGVLSFSWPSARRFTDDERKLAETLALQAAQALERARLYDEAEAARRLLWSALESVDYGVVVRDVAGRTEFANSAAARIVGLRSGDEYAAMSRDEMNASFQLLDDDGRPFPEEALPDRAALAGRRGEEVTVRYRRRGHAEERWARMAASPILDGNGKVARVVLVFRDVTVERREEQQRAFLLRAIEQFNSTVDYEATLKSVAREAVPALGDWCGIDLVEEGAPKLLTVAHVDPEKVAHLEELFRRYPPGPGNPSSPEEIVATRRPILAETITREQIAARARDPEHLALIERLGLRSFLAVPMIAGQRVIGVLRLAMAESGRTFSTESLRFASDFADRAAIAIENARLFRATARALESEQRARTRAEEAARFAELFAGILGHDLRNPLGAIGTGAHLILRHATDDRVRRPAGRIISSTERMARMVDQLLDFTPARRRRPHARPRRDGPERHGAPHRRGDRGGQRLPDPGRARRRDDRRVGSGSAGAGALQPARERGAPRHDRPPDPAPPRRARRGVGAGGGAQPRADPGRVLPRIFEPFQGGGGHRRAAMSGLGLGLYITHAIVAAHRGRIDVASTDEEGTIFTVELPRRCGRAPSP